MTTSSNWMNMSLLSSNSVEFTTILSWGEKEVNSSDSKERFRSTLSANEDFLIGIYLVTLGLLSVMLNFLVIIVAYYKRRVLKPAEWFIISLACVDLVMTITAFPMPIASAFRHQWYFGDNGCRWYAFVVFVTGLSSINILSTMSVFRVLKTIHQGFGTRLNKKWTAATLAICCVYSLIWAVLPLVGFGRYGLEPTQISCSIDWSSREDLDITYVNLVFVVCFAVPCLLMIVSYGTIFRVTRWNGRKLNGNCQARERRKRITKLTFMICVTFVASWTPYALVSMWAAYGNPDDIPVRLSATPSIFAKTCTIINPVIYFFINPRFRKATRECLMCPCALKIQVAPFVDNNKPVAVVEQYKLPKLDAIKIHPRQSNSTSKSSSKYSGRMEPRPPTINGCALRSSALNGR